MQRRGHINGECRGEGRDDVPKVRVRITQTGEAEMADPHLVS